MNKDIDIDAIARNVVKKMFSDLNKADEHSLGLIKTIIDVSADVTASILKDYHEAISSKK